MTRKKNYIEYNLNVKGVKLSGKVPEAEYLDDIDDICQYIVTCLKMDLNSVRKHLNEVSKVSDNLDSE